MIPAQDFDIMGVMGFIVLSFLAIKIIKEKNLKNYGYIILLISIIGAIADSYSVLTNFILK